MDIFTNLKNVIKKKPLLKSFFTLTGFILVLSISWFYFSQSPRDEEKQIHAYLQDEFQTLVSDFVAKKHPEVDEIIFHKVWTKDIPDSNQIKIFFSYSLLTKGSEGGELLIEGEAVLDNSQEQKELWIVKDFQVTDSVMDFSEPLVIKGIVGQEIK